MAAYEVMIDLGGDEKGPIQYKSVGKDRFFSLYNYLKHAIADPYDLHDLPPKATELALWDCVGAFERMYDSRTTLMAVLFCVFYASRSTRGCISLRKRGGVPSRRDGFETSGDAQQN